MILLIHRDKKFDEKIREFLGHGGTSLAAARKAEEIIGRIIDQGSKNGLSFGRRTRNGELRIKNCIKYDLGNGYRMVCLKKEHRFIVLYIGTHDECSRWLERNKNLIYDLNNASCEQIETKKGSHSMPVQEVDPADAYEKALLQKVDDRILRKIFCGISERNEKQLLKS